MYTYALKDGSTSLIYSTTGHDQGAGEAPVAYTYGLLDARLEARTAIQTIRNRSPDDGTDIFSLSTWMIQY